jgi:hypothetical protein
VKWNGVCASLCWIEEYCDILSDRKIGLRPARRGYVKKKR